jgi:hypothetical protein
MDGGIADCGLQIADWCGSISTGAFDGASSGEAGVLALGVLRLGVWAVQPLVSL